MAFPQTTLPLISEMLIGDDWVNVTDDRYIDDNRKLTITRGRQDWASRAVASECDQAFRNKDGKYSNRNPLSPYFRLLGRETELRHRIQLDAATFAGNAVNSWGATDGGLVFNLFGAGGSILGSDWQRTDGEATISVPVANASRTANIAGASWTDVEARVTFQCSISDVTGASIEPAAILLRGVSTSVHHMVRVVAQTDETMRLQIYNQAGTTLYDAVLPGQTWAANTDYVLSAAIQGRSIRAKLWREAGREPSSWDVTVWDPNTAIVPGWVGVRAGVASGNSNVKPIVTTFKNLIINRFRFWGKTQASAPTSDLSGKKVLAPFKAAGILQELSAGNPPTLSAMRRTILAEEPVAYYPLEDASGTTQFASALSEGTAILSNFFGAGTVNAAADSNMVGSAALPLMTPGTSIDFEVPDYTETGTLTVTIPVRFNTDDVPGITVHIDHVNGVETKLIILPDPSFPYISADGSQGLTTYWSDSDPFTSLADLIGKNLQLELNGIQSSGAWLFNVRDDTGAILRSFGGTSVAAYAKIKRISVDAATSFSVEDPLTVGHVQAYGHTPNLALTAKAMAGHTGETAGYRMIRAAGEANVPFFMTGDPADTALVGPQPTATITEILFRAAEADQGILHEPRDAYALTYRPRTTLYDQSPVELGYTAGVIAPPFLPTEDDQILLNDVIAKRDNGSFARVKVVDGPLGTQAIGTRPEELAWNVFGDDQLPGIAGWRARQGTWDEARYPALTVNMAAPDVAANTVLTDAVAGKDIGDVSAVTDLPAWLPPDDVSLMIEGSTETFGNGKEWSITWLCVPAGPWRVYEYASGPSDTNPDAGVYGEDRLELVSAVGAGDTTWVAYSDPLFTRDPAEMPIDAQLGGELVTITAVAPAVDDTFNRNTASGLGSTPAAQAWTTSGGVAADYSTTTASGGQAGILFSVANASKRGQVGPTFADGVVRAVVRPEVVAATAAIDVGLQLRRDNAAGNCYEVLVRFLTTGATQLRINEVIAGAATALATISLPYTYTAASTFEIYAQIIGDQLWARAWDTAVADPYAWQALVDAGGVTAAGLAGIACRVQSGNTNVPFTPHWNEIQVLSPVLWTVARSVNGVVKPHDPADVREKTITLPETAIYVP